MLCYLGQVLQPESGVDAHSSSTCHMLISSSLLPAPQGETHFAPLFGLFAGLASAPCRIWVKLEPQ